MKPVVSRLARQGYPIRKVDVDRNPDLVRKFRITGIPAFVLVINDKEVTRVVGYASERRLKQMMARIPKAPEKKPAAKALPITKSSNSSAPVRLVKDIGNRFRLPFLSKKRNPERAIDQPPAELKNAIVRAKLDQAQPRTPRVVRDTPMAASTRIRIKDSGGVNYGSGTVIDSRVGRTIVLTCGHIFRGLKKTSVVEVDVFTDGKPATYVGTPLKYDLQADVGLIAIPTQSAIPIANVAALNDAAERGDRVLSIGCGGGAEPSRLRIRVTELNRYRGPDNIECTGVPEQGRSGGGLFNARGEVVGVCFAADPRDRRGLYAGLRPIHDLLVAAGLKRLVNDSRRQPDAASEADSKFATATAADGSPAGLQTAAADRSRLQAVRAAIAESRNSSPEESKLLNRLRSADAANRLKTVADVFRKSSEAEVICVIRPLSDPQAASRVVIINRASEKFVEYLNNELRDQPVATSKSMKYAQTSPRGYVRTSRAAKPAVSRPASTSGTVSARRVVRPASRRPRNSDEPERYRRSRSSR